MYNADYSLQYDFNSYPLTFARVYGIMELTLMRGESMIELQQLRQLIAIEKAGTISKAAEETFLTQSALSRSMQRLESDLGVTIFARKKNRVELNENGKLAVSFAKKLLSDFDYYIDSVKAFDKSRKTISVGCCAPAPVWLLVPKLSTEFPEKTVTGEIKNGETLIKGLLDETYQIIITAEPNNLPECVTREFCKERLYLCVPHNHKLAKKESVSYSDLDGISMLLYEQLGTWNKIRDFLPNTRFIVQTDRNAFNDLIAESTLPVFTTNVTVKLFGAPQGRVALPVDEAGAVGTFYISALKKNKDLIPR